MPLEQSFKDCHRHRLRTTLCQLCYQLLCFSRLQGRTNDNWTMCPHVIIQPITVPPCDVVLAQPSKPPHFLSALSPVSPSVSQDLVLAVCYNIPPKRAYTIVTFIILPFWSLQLMGTILWRFEEVSLYFTAFAESFMTSVP